jgi:hypothetical protein
MARLAPEWKKTGSAGLDFITKGSGATFPPSVEAWSQRTVATPESGRQLRRPYSRIRYCRLRAMICRAIRQAEVGAAKTMIERTEGRFGLTPERLIEDSFNAELADGRSLALRARG